MAVLNANETKTKKAAGLQYPRTSAERQVASILSVTCQPASAAG